MTVRTLLAKEPAGSITHDFAAGPILAGAWSQLTPRIGFPADAVEIWCSCDVPLQISFGTPGNEANSLFKYTITPCGSPIIIPFPIQSQNEPLAVSPIGQDADVGDLILNFFK
jgi:hypothetical protein